MDIKNLQYVVGQAENDKPAIIRFFNSVTEYSTKEFNEEFLWLQDVIKPSKIIVMINSEGGSVIHGMSTFSFIQSCPIEVDCVIEGIAASMGSVIWAAGDNLYMHDYSLLMIHNPFNQSSDCQDEGEKPVIDAFKSQLATIYQKRFGMTKDQVKSIMDGEGAADGTFFTAREAVKAGFLDNEHVIKTSKQLRDKVKNQIEGIADRSSIRDIMSAVSAEINENKLLEEIEAIHNRKDNQHFQESKVMEENENRNFDTISAQLGFSKDAKVANISARIAELIKAETDLKDVQDKYTQLEIKFNGKEADLANVNSELEKTKASLKEYQDAEKAAFEAKIDATIQDAINSGKIEDSAKEAWTKMAHSDFATVQATLESIHGRDNITDKIANDKENQATIEDTLKTVEEKEADKVKAVCGDIKLNSF